MKTVVTRAGGGPVTFEAFAEHHGLWLQVAEQAKYRADNPTTWTATLVTDGASTDSSGQGPTPEEATADLKTKLRGQTLRMITSIQCPNEWSEP